MKCDKCKKNEAKIKLDNTENLCLDCYNKVVSELIGIKDIEDYSKDIYIYDNNGNKGQYKCKVCNLSFKETNYATKPIVFICPYCGATLAEQKQRKHFRIHKCNNSKCSYYQKNLKKLPDRKSVV